MRTTEPTIADNASRTKARLGILALITGATMINYLDRAVMGVAAPALTEELGLSAAVLGIVFSAFSWTYALAQIPGGIILDKLGTRVTYSLALGLWSLCTLFHGLAANVSTLLGLRLGLGVAEAPCFPANSRVLATWFPQSERARANGVYSVGMYAGLAFFSPVLFWIVASWGWRSLFLIVGSLGIIYAAIFHSIYRAPSRHPRVNAAELDHIAAGGGLESQTAVTQFSWSRARALLGKRQILGASVGQFAGNVTLVFFLTWFPTYLATERGMDWIQSGSVAVLPYMAASAGVLLGGVVSDWLIRFTGSANIGRKLPVVSGLLLASTIILANYVQSNTLVILIMSVAFFGQGMVNLGWTLVSDVAPKQYVGLVGGLFNFCTNLAGVITPLMIGFIVAATGRFEWALVVIGVVALLGAFSYIFIVGDVHRLEME